MELNVQKITDNLISEIDIFMKDSNSLDPYSYEKALAAILNNAGKKLFQASIGKIPKGDNSKVKVKTTFGEIEVPKNHPMSLRPMGFQVSPCLQEHICRLGSKLVFSEASEELWQFLDIEISDKQIERICHCYGEKLDEIDWANAYSDSVQLKLSYKQEEPVYVMVDGSMILTREDSWKEVKLGRIFSENSLIKISKERTLLSDSVYAAHLGSASEFWERFAAEIPPSENLVFINDGARWIWNYIQERYPESTQILDFYHCKEHIFEFAKEFFTDKQKTKVFSEEICELLLNEKVDDVFEKIEKLETKSASKIKAKEKVLTYLNNNKTRINYGNYRKQGLLIGSGAIESAQRDVIQKRVKLSGQRWTIKGAQQIINLRVYKKSGRWKRLLQIIKDNQFNNKKAA